MSQVLKQVIHGLWRRKDLSYLMHSDQEHVDRHWRKTKARKYYLRCSRRWGKSFWKCVRAVQTAIEFDDAEVRYAAPTQKMAKSIVEPHLRRICRDAPEEMRPDFRVQDQIWQFPNGSKIILAGVDNGGAERLRGTATKLGLLDEAGMMDDLDYIISDILLPQTITVDGCLIIGSTPPKTPAHAFKRGCLQAMQTGAHIHRTIFDAPHITPSMIEEYMEESGGKESTTWKREYMADFVTEESVMIVPEFPKHRSVIVREWKRPEHFYCWVVADVGFNDLTVIGFFYVDFYAGKLVLEDELVFVRTRSEVVNKAVRQKLEALRWPEPVSFIADTLAKNTIVDMSDDETSWSPPVKHNAEAAINLLRLFVHRDQLVVNPRCKVVLSHLDYGIWNKSRTSFERSDEFGHFDGIDMLKYACRSVDLSSNPYPGDRLPTLDNHFVRGTLSSQDPLEDLFRRPTR